MEEMYTLHELQSEEEVTQNPEPHMQDNPAETAAVFAPAHEPIILPTPSHNLEFVLIEEPNPHLEMELAQAYVRTQPLEGVFSPEEGLRMGTAFPNLSQPYAGRE